MKFLKAASIFVAACVPFAASAHEVYVLTPDQVQAAIATPSFSEWGTAISNLHSFMLWAFIAILTVFVVFFAGISHWLEKMIDPYLAKLPKYAPIIGRFTLGLSFLAAAYFGALFGPELPLASTFGAYAPAVRLVVVLLGVLFLTGYYVRTAALVAFALYLASWVAHGQYMLTYTNYAGELILLSILGGSMFALQNKKHDHFRAPHWLKKLMKDVAPYAFLITRIAFGCALIYASLFAKVFHNQLALDVASMPLAGHLHGIAYYFGLEPHFMVLGAAIVEVVIGVFFIIGFEIRFTSLFLLFWLTMSLAYFGEVVWPHLILIGIPLSFICYGYDKYSFEGVFFKKGRREPVF